MVYEDAGERLLGIAAIGEPAHPVTKNRYFQIWPQRALGTLFRPNLAGYRAVGPHPAPCGQSWEVLTHYEATFELSRYVGFPLEPVRGLWGM